MGSEGGDPEAQAPWDMHAPGGLHGGRGIGHWTSPVVPEPSVCRWVLPTFAQAFFEVHVVICPVQEPTADTSITLAEGEESSMGGQAFCLRRRLHISMQESDVQHGQC